jgi:hypothetical protein
MAERVTQPGVSAQASVMPLQPPLRAAHFGKTAALRAGSVSSELT